MKDASTVTTTAMEPSFKPLIPFRCQNNPKDQRDRVDQFYQPTLCVRQIIENRELSAATGNKFPERMFTRLFKRVTFLKSIPVVPCILVR